MDHSQGCGPQAVCLWFDFVSPYAWLALEQVEGFGVPLGVRWKLRPFVFGALLVELGRTAPAEIPAQRAYVARDVARIAQKLGLEFTGAPSHPFRTIASLRAALLHADQDCALPVARELARACWGKGLDLNDPEVVVAAVARGGGDPEDLAQRAKASAIKAQLKANTEAAKESGLFGVPTFEIPNQDGSPGELFWGHDRLELLGERLRGELPPPGETAERWLQQPMGVRLDRAQHRPPK